MGNRLKQALIDYFNGYSEVGAMHAGSVHFLYADDGYSIIVDNALKDLKID